MSVDHIRQKTVQASKWSAVTELAVKLVQPISNLILVRILAPEAFAAVATINMVVSFADLFTDAGFQRYIIQQDYESDQEKELVVNVAFWTNLGLSVFLWFVIFFCKNPISKVVGASELAVGIVVASLALPMTSFSSIQMALFKRDFNFKVLFYTRVFSAIVPMIVTIPLALLGLGYWAIVIGTLSGRLFDAVFLTVLSNWKPAFAYDFTVLKEMFGFSAWSLIESISTWLTIWIGVFIVGIRMSDYYAGLYSTVINTVNSIMAIIVGATTSVLFSSLSRLKDDREAYLGVFFGFQRTTAMFVMPMGIGMFVFQEPITALLLGRDWMEGAPLLGAWGLCYSFSIIFGNLISEVYRSLGKPKLSVLAQILHIVFLAPVCYCFSGRGFVELAYARSFARFEFVFVHLLIVYFILKISPWKMIKNILPYLFSAIVMGAFGGVLRSCSESTFVNMVFIAACACIYFCVLLLGKNTRKELLLFVRKALTRGG